MASTAVVTVPVTAMEYTRFERARIIGARALQISMGAPVLIVIPEDLRNPVEVAMLEFRNGAIPITVQRPRSGPGSPAGSPTNPRAAKAAKAS